MEKTNPATEEITSLKETPITSISKMIEAARTTQKTWRDLTTEARVSVILGLKPLIQERQDILAKAISQDMGKPIKNGLEEVNDTIFMLDYFCSKACEWLRPEKVEEGYVSFDPLGVVAVISPWNFPLYVSFESILPALLAGNGVIYKPSEYALGTGIEIGLLFQELPNFPEGILQLVIGGKDHGKTLVRESIQMVSFTGSTVAGKDIMKNAADNLKKVLLELGGLDAAIVLKDADIPRTARALVKNNCSNTGQVCCAVKRVYVESPVYEEFVKAVTEESRKITFGDPGTDVYMGPMVAKFQLEKVTSILEDAVTKGAKVLSGGKKPEGKGFFFPSTVVTNVNNTMRILKEEPFGPILPICAVSSWEEGVKLANDTPYGLTSSVWTSNTELGKKIAGKLEVGVAGINRHGPGGPGSPWGGTKESGLGRMDTKEGMREYTNVKLVRVPPDERAVC